MDLENVSKVVEGYIVKERADFWQMITDDGWYPTAVSKVKASGHLTDEILAAIAEDTIDDTELDRLGVLLFDAGCPADYCRLCKLEDDCHRAHEALQKTFITKFRGMRQKELQALDWGYAPSHQCGVVVELSNGNKLIASRDPEGNGPGFIFIGLPNGETAYPTLEDA